MAHTYKGQIYTYKYVFVYPPHLWAVYIGHIWTVCMAHLYGTYVYIRFWTSSMAYMDSMDSVGSMDYMDSMASVDTMESIADMHI